MKNVYFDTSIYNHILDNQNITPEDKLILVGAIQDKQVRILFSHACLAEFSHTYSKNLQIYADRTKKLFSLALEICSGPFIKLFKDVIREEFLSYINRTASFTPYAKGKDKNLYASMIKIMASHPEANADYLISLNKDSKEDKKIFKNHLKRGVSVLKNVLQGELGEVRSFSEYVEVMNNTPRLRKQAFNNIMQGVISKNRINRRAKHIGFNTIPSVRLYFYGNSAFYWLVVKEGIPLNGGEFFDVQHLASACKCHIFVTGDEPLLKVCRILAEPKIKFFNLPGFIRYLKEMNTRPTRRSPVE